MKKFIPRMPYEAMKKVSQSGPVSSNKGKKAYNRVKVKNTLLRELKNSKHLKSGIPLFFLAILTGACPLF